MYQHSGYPTVAGKKAKDADEGHNWWSNVLPQEKMSINIQRHYLIIHWSERSESYVHHHSTCLSWLHLVHFQHGGWQTKFIADQGPAYVSGYKIYFTKHHTPRVIPDLSGEPSTTTSYIATLLKIFICNTESFSSLIIHWLLLIFQAVHYARYFYSLAIFCHTD